MSDPMSDELSALAEAVTNQTTAVTNFIDQQIEVFTTTEDTVTITDANGNPVVIPSWHAVSVTNGSTVQTLQTQQAANAAAITTLQSSTTAMAASITDLQTRMTTAEATLVTVGTTLTSLQTQITNNGTNITALQTTVSAIQTLQSTDETHISAAQTAATSASVAATNAQSTANTALALATKAALPMRTQATAATVSGVVSIAVSTGSSIYALTLTENLTAWDFSALPPSGYVARVRVKLTQGSSAFTCVSPATSGMTAGGPWSVSTNPGDVQYLDLDIDSAGNVTLFPSDILS